MQADDSVVEVNTVDTMIVNGGDVMVMDHSPNDSINEGVDDTVCDEGTTEADESPRSMSQMSGTSTPSLLISKYNNNNTIHHLPCSIDYDGPAPIEDYFRVSECKTRGPGKLVSHFRGRQLFGERVKLPADIQILNVRSTPSGLLPKWSVRGRFEEIIAWEHDRLPETTSVKNMVDWMELASAVCCVCGFFLGPCLIPPFYIQVHDI
jgi:hypothetical protein